MRSFARLSFMVLTIGGVAWGSQVAADDAGEATPSAELTSDNHKAVIQEMKGLVEDIRLVRQGKTPLAAELVPEPVLNWDDLPRGHHHGTLWIWGSTGRPCAIMEMFTLNFSRTIDGWPGNVVHSLAAEPLVAEGGRRWNWRPQQPGFTPQAVTEAPVPGTTKSQRRQQMRSLAKRFSANETMNGSRTELRLLTTPVWYYESPNEGIIDGGLFAFVHGGTNPETILILEATKDEENKTTWQFGCVRLGHAQMEVALDDLKVWSAETYYGSNPTSAYYWLLP